MNRNWREVTFEDVFEISSSKRVLQKQWRTSGIPFYRAREIVKLAQFGSVQNELFISEEMFEDFKNKYGAPEPGDLMVSAVGTLGACYVVQPRDRFYYKDASVLRFRPKEPIDSRFIQYTFRTNYILDQINSGSGSTVGTFTISRAKKTRLLLPPLAEQKRIAEILDTADALRARRRESLAQLDTLLQATFLDMFGDPVTNPMGWERRLLGTITSIDAPMVDPKKTEYRRLLHYGPDRISKDSGELLPAQTAEEDQLISGKFLCSPGEILYSKIRPYLNKVALVKQTCLCSADVYPVRPDAKSLSKEYLVMLLRSKAFLDYVAGFSRRANIPKLNRKQFAGYAAPVPPLDLQRRFAAIVEAVERQKARQRAHLSELDTLFAALQQRAFTGEL